MRTALCLVRRGGRPTRSTCVGEELLNMCDGGTKPVWCVGSNLHLCGAVGFLVLPEAPLTAVRVARPALIGGAAR